MTLVVTYLASHVKPEAMPPRPQAVGGASPRKDTGSRMDEG